MSTIPSYESEPYRRELTTTVVETGEEDGRPFAVLEDTILYPGGGGQPADRGRLGEVEILEARRADGAIRHDLATAVERGPVTVTLDWARRYDHMQQHTAQHLLSAVALHRFGWATTSFHLGVERSDVELDVGSLSDADLEQLEEGVAVEVRAARSVVARRVSADEYAAQEVRRRSLPADYSGDVRLVEIVGLDTATCGGTHLASTAEIEAVHLLGTEKMRGGTRLHWVAGRRVRRLLAAHERKSGELRRLLETSDEELVDVAAAKLTQLAEGKRERRSLEGKLAEAVAASLAGAEERVVDTHLDDAEASILQAIGRGLIERQPGKIALLTASGPKGHFFLVAAGEDAGIDLPDCGREVAELLDGRGGGAKGIFQGKAGSLESRAEAVAAVRAAAGRRGD